MKFLLMKVFGSSKCKLFNTEAAESGRARRCSRARESTLSFVAPILSSITFCTLLLAIAHAAETGAVLENKFIVMSWNVVGGKLHSIRIDDKLNGGSLPLTGEEFQIVLGDGTVLKTSDFKLIDSPRVEAVKTDSKSPVQAQYERGKQLIAKFTSPERNLSVDWRIILRNNSPWLREALTLQAGGKDVLIKEIILFDQTVPSAKTIGTVDGSPVVAGNFFFGY